MATATTSPAVEGWFTTGERPALLGSRCAACRTVFFPREAAFCRNPGCTSEDFDEVELSRRGRVWSYTDAQYHSLAQITRLLLKQYPALTRERIVGHSDVAPGRKTDPGPAFDWRRYRQLIDQKERI